MASARGAAHGRSALALLVVALGVAVVLSVDRRTAEVPGTSSRSADAGTGGARAAEAPDASAAGLDVEVLLDPVVQELDLADRFVLVLRPLRAQGDEERRVPLSGATLGGPASTHRLELRALPAGTYELELEPLGHVERLELAAGTTVPRTLDLARLAVVAVDVLDADGTPRPDAVLSVLRQVDGTWHRMRALPGGDEATHRLVAVPGPVTVELASATTPRTYAWELAPGRDHRHLVVEPEYVATLPGDALEQAGLDPDAWLSAELVTGPPHGAVERLAVRTTVDGAPRGFTLFATRPGAYRLRVPREGAAAVELDLEARAPEPER